MCIIIEIMDILLLFYMMYSATAFYCNNINIGLGLF